MAPAVHLCRHYLTEHRSPGHCVAACGGVGQIVDDTTRTSCDDCVRYLPAHYRTEQKEPREPRLIMGFTVRQCFAISVIAAIEGFVATVVRDLL